MRNDCSRRMYRTLIDRLAERDVEALAMFPKALRYRSIVGIDEK